MSKEHAAKVMQEIFSKGTYEGDLLGINEGRKMSDTPRTDELAKKFSKTWNQFAYRSDEDIAKQFRNTDDALDLARQLERELAEARKDAERYRWLKEHICWSSDCISKTYYFTVDINEELDAAIDAAMKEWK